MTEKTKYFPNIPVIHWINLRAQFKKSIPGTITSNYLASILGMTEASAKANITPTLRQIGLIDSEGKTDQELAKKLRDDTLYPQFCKEVIEKIYPQELIDAFPDKGASREKIKTWFMNHTGVGDSAASRIVSFYVAIVEADPNSVNSTPNTSKPKDTKAKVASPVTKAIGKSEEKETNEQKSPPEHNQNRHNAGPDLNINNCLSASHK